MFCMKNVLRNTLRFALLFLIGPAFLPATSHGKEAKPVRIALYADKGVGGKGVPNLARQLGGSEEFVVTNVTARDIASGILKNFDVVIFSGGSAHRQSDNLGTTGVDEVRSFVKSGGGYIGICAGAYLACSGFDWGLAILNAKTVSPIWQRGKGLVQIEVTSLGASVTSLTADRHQVLYANGPILKPDSRKDLPAYEPIGFFRTELAEHNSPPGVMLNTPAIARSTCGEGRVLVFSPHPEQTTGMEKVIAHAVRWVAKTNAE
jgi:putative intracellular protease/amidase